MGLMSRLFGSHSDHELKRIYPIVDRIEALEPQMSALSDEELKSMAWTTFVSGIQSSQFPHLVQYLKERRLYVNELVEGEVEL